MTTTDVAIRHDDLGEKVEWAKTLAVANLLPKAFQNNPGNLLFAVEYADALGISRINAITSIHVIDGKPSASADLIAALVRRAGHTLRVTGDDTKAAAVLIRADDREFSYEAVWTMEKAKAAGLTGKGVWKNYPAAMLRSRAITEVARMGASEALLGLIYTPEELGADVDQTGAPVKATATVQPTSGADRIRAIVVPQSMPPETSGPADLTTEPFKRVSHIDEPAPVDLGSAPEALSAAQLKLIHVELGRVGKGDDRDWALNFYDQTIGHPVDSSKQLSKSEASDVIEALKALPDKAPDAWATGEFPIDEGANA